MVVLFFAAGAGLLAYGATDYLVTNRPPTLTFVQGHKKGDPVHITIQTVGTIGYGQHPGWVSYLTKTPNSTKWVHTTIWRVPSHTKIVLTNTEYDGTAAPLRNAVWGKVSGTKGTVEYVNGKPYHYVYSGDHYGTVAHTFTVAALGVNVPWYGVTATRETKDGCGVAPCTPTKYAHQVDRVTFTSGAPSQYRWQCLIPCAAGFLDGNGGPMQALGYMDGFLKVQPTGSQHLHVGDFEPAIQRT